MLNRLLFPFYQAPNNGKQLVGLGNGRRLLLGHSTISGPGELWLRATATREPRRLEEFGAPVSLAGRPGAVEERPGFGGSMTLDARGTLHVAWTSQPGIRHVALPGAEQSLLKPALPRGTVSEAVPGPATLGDILIAQGQVHLTFRKVLDRSTEALGLGRLGPRGWVVRELWRGSPVFPPVAHGGEDGSLHLAWHDVPGRLWYGRLGPDGKGQGQPVKIDDVGRQPSLLSVGESVLIVYEDE
jgi:hypothetical protein